MALVRKFFTIIGLLFGMRNMEADYKEKNLTVIKTKPLDLLYMRERLKGESEERIKEVESFLAIIQCMNESGDDARIENPRGALMALIELRDFFVLTGRPVFMRFNDERNEKGEPYVYFEV